MHHGSNIYTIHSPHNSAPPSYAEAMQQSRHISSDHITSYNQENSQMPSYPHPQPNHFYSHVQPAYDTMYTTVPNQQIQTTSTSALTNTVTVTGSRAEKPIFTCCRIIWAASVFIITLVGFIMVIQQFNK